MKEQVKKDKKEITLKIRGSLDDVLRVATKGNPKPIKKSKSK
jgi:hypothetical protein